ncbi:hypothetical protein DFH08DRAFT_792024 [Mycena albidolilacea]|uniref:DUF6697 domain-containing protein n=1 Tax=Mycena albidolilacea TaxID=1033008 RepID=A0AAD6Z6U1_9AGAR|nr:hypothetical protein DFH08DRAFT_792024 [Mycena albidolilacea]
MSVVEMALEVEVERARAIEALSARDAAIQRLSEACVSVRQKTTIIERLQKGQAQPEQVAALELTVKTLREEIVSLTTPLKSAADPPPSYIEVCFTDAAAAGYIRTASIMRTLAVTPSSSATASRSEFPAKRLRNGPPLQVAHTALKSSEPEDIIKARNALLATIPLPADPPDDTLKPIIIPPPFTLHEFLANATGVTFPLSNYRVLQELTTSWCPEREEHGYLLTPLFKCSTNPRVATAHRWTAVDVVARMNKPTECFYNKDGNWYYAGVYKAFRLEDLTTKEWEALSAETTQALIKDTLTGRKNTSPQNIYETAQLYAAGALRVACVGLRCVGFNQGVYRGVLEQAAAARVAHSSGKGGLGVGGGAWNATVNGNGAAGEGVGGVAGGIAGMSIGGGGNENVPVQGGGGNGKGKK